MNYSVATAKSARQDMLQAAKYIAEKLYNPTAADRLLDEADEAICSLEEQPMRYPLVRDEYLANLGIRLLPVRNYLVFYVVREKSHSVTVLRFLYGKRDWASILRGETKPE